MLLGAHVSSAGGVERAPSRGTTVGATAIQIFTKTPSQWHEPALTAHRIEAFHAAVRASTVSLVVSHDSYLINLASPNRSLRARSLASFVAELERCAALRIPYVVTHPGNYMTRRDAGLKRNARAYAEALNRVPGPTILIETTAGTGTALGSRFEELAALVDLIPPALRMRVGFCADTCHLFAAGYDLRGAFDAVWSAWDRVLGLERLRVLHLNDSKHPLGSRRDRHELIGQGTLGADPFRRLMRDGRFRPVAKIIETPKGDDPVRTDRRMLRRLRAYARVRRSRSSP